LTKIVANTLKNIFFRLTKSKKNRLATYLKTDKNSGDKRTLTFTSSKLFSYQHLINGAAEPIPEKWSQSKINTTLRQKNVAQAIDTILAAMVGFIPEEFFVHLLRRLSNKTYDIKLANEVTSNLDSEMINSAVAYIGSFGLNKGKIPDEIQYIKNVVIRSLTYNMKNSNNLCAISRRLNINRRNSILGLSNDLEMDDDEEEDIDNHEDEEHLVIEYYNLDLSDSDTSDTESDVSDADGNQTDLYADQKRRRLDLINNEIKKIKPKRKKRSDKLDCSAVDSWWHDNTEIDNSHGSKLVWFENYNKNTGLSEEIFSFHQRHLQVDSTEEMYAHFIESNEFQLFKRVNQVESIGLKMFYSHRCKCIKFDPMECCSCEKQHK